MSVLGERWALIFGYVCGAAGNACFGLASSGLVFLAGIPLAALYGVSSPALQSMMTSRVGPSEQGRLQGAMGSLMSMASMTAPVLFTQAFALTVGPYRALGLPGVPFLMAAAILIGALSVALRAPARPTAAAAGVQ